jgi:hypothetical protein
MNSKRDEGAESLRPDRFFGLSRKTGALERLTLEQ